MRTLKKIFLFTAILALAPATYAQQSDHVPAAAGLVADSDISTSTTYDGSTSAAESADEGPCYGSSIITCCADTPDWFYFTADTLFLELDGPNARALVIDDITAVPILTTGDLDYPQEPGARLTFGWGLAPCTALEVSYFGMNHWGAGATVLGNNDISLPFPSNLLDFVNADAISVGTYSEVQNAEANLLRIFGSPNFALLAGLRFFHIRERFTILSFDADSGESPYAVRARNELFGAQIGGRWQKMYGRFGLECIGKTGLYGNRALQRQVLWDANTTVLRRATLVETTEPAFLSEVGLNAVCQFGNHWAVRGGYQAIWLDDVARAADQLDFTSGPLSGRTLTTANSFLHGPHLGFEARW